MPFELVSGGRKQQGDEYQLNTGEAFSAQLSEVGAERPPALWACFSFSSWSDVI